MDKTDIEQRIHAAINILAIRDDKLLQFNVHERSVTHKLAQYLEFFFPDYDVDCEYNRIGDDGLTKKILVTLRQDLANISSDSEEPMGPSVFPDIIVHRRGDVRSEGKLLVIEAKKHGLDTTFDKQKLSAYKDFLEYQHAYLLVLPASGSFATSELLDIDQLISQ